MDIKSKGKWILGKLWWINYLIFGGTLGFGVYKIKYRPMEGAIWILISIGVLACKILYSEMKVLMLIYALDGAISSVSEERGIKVISNEFSREIPSFLKVNTKIYKNICLIVENVREYVQNKSKNEQIINRLINNVVDKLKMPVENIRQGIEKLKVHDGSLDEIHEEALYTKKLIEELFEATKASSGALSMNKENVDINYILKQAIAEFSSSIEGSKLNYQVNISSEKSILFIDPERVWRVFQILLENTLKHSLDGTRVYIDAGAYEENYILTIKSIARDKLNISSDELYNIIEKKKDEKCTGLPLETAKSIIENLDGELKVYIDGDLFKTEIKFKLKEVNKDATSST